VGIITLKVDSGLFEDAGYCSLSAQSQATFWGLMALAGTKGIASDLFLSIYRADARPHLEDLGAAGLIRFEVDAHGQEMIVPTGKIAWRYTDAKRVSEWRRKKRAQAAGTLRDELGANPQTISQHSAKPLQATVSSPAGSDDGDLAALAHAHDVTLSSATPTAHQPGIAASEQGVARALERIVPRPDPADRPMQHRVRSTTDYKRIWHNFHSDGIFDRMVADGLSESLATELLNLRKAKRAPMTSATWEHTKQVATAIGWTLVDTCREWLIGGWSGVQVNYFVGKMRPHERTSSRAFEDALSAQKIKPDYSDGTWTKDHRGQWKKRVGGVVL